MSIIKILLSIIFWIFPWQIRRVLLNTLFGYRISDSARIGFSVIVSDRLEMLDGARIGHLTVCKGMNIIRLGAFSSIGNLNWISGLPVGNKSFFSHRTSRNSNLIIGAHSAVTHRHLLNCTDTITIGDFTTIAGNHSQFLTHSIDIMEARQDCKPVVIGSYCFVGTSCVILPGTALGDFSVLGAKSLLNKIHLENYCLYGGVPAVLVKKLPKDAKYFTRKTGYIY